MAITHVELIATMFVFYKSGDDLCAYLQKEPQNACQIMHCVVCILKKELVNLHPQPLKKLFINTIDAATNYYNALLQSPAYGDSMETQARLSFISTFDKMGPAIEYLMENNEPVAEEIDHEAVYVMTPLVKENLMEKVLISLCDKSIIKYAYSDEVIFMEANSNYTRIKLINNQIYTVSRALKEHEAILPDTFVRVSRSAIVNSDFVASMSRGKDLVVMTDKTQISVTQNANLLLGKKGWSWK